MREYLCIKTDDWILRIRALNPSYREDDVILRLGIGTSGHLGLGGQRRLSCLAVRGRVSAGWLRIGRQLL
jgi:hypothetical protein